MAYTETQEQHAHSSSESPPYILSGRHSSFSFSLTNAHFMLPSRQFLNLHPSAPTHLRKEQSACYRMVIKVCSDWIYIRTPYHFNARALIRQDTGCNWILIGY